MKWKVARSSGWGSSQRFTARVEGGAQAAGAAVRAFHALHHAPRVAAIAGEVGDARRPRRRSPVPCRASAASSWNAGPAGCPGSMSRYRPRNQNGGNQRSSGLWLSTSGRIAGAGQRRQEQHDDQAAHQRHLHPRRNAAESAPGEQVDQHALHARDAQRDEGARPQDGHARGPRSASRPRARACLRRRSRAARAACRRNWRRSRRVPRNDTRASVLPAKMEPPPSGSGVRIR